jgi:gluconokinase
MDILIGLDLGTTNCKAVALAETGALLATASCGYPLLLPRQGWVEQDAQAVWRGALSCLQELLRQVPVAQVAGLCLSGAMHSLLPVGAEGVPLAPAMTWGDQRAAAKVSLLRSRCDPLALYQRTGCPLQALYHPAKLRWWVDEAPQVTGQAARFVAIKDWVLNQLTGCWITDFSLASATGLQDTHRFTWDEEALVLAGIEAGLLPRLVSPTQAAGGLTPAASRQTGLPSGLPVVAGASDGALANLGAGAHQPGQMVITVGTSGAIRCLVDRPRFDPHERTWCYVFGEGRWFAGGAINNAGLAVQWVRERFYSGLEDHLGFQQLMEEAAGVAPGAEGVVLLPYFTGERNPHWDSKARAALFGLSLEHARPQIARAALEGVAFCLADVWEAVEGAGAIGAGELLEPARLTGGITQSPLWVQIVSDVLGLPLAPVEAADASAAGAAMLGYHALQGRSLQSLAGGVQAGSVILPDPERQAFYARKHRAFQELYRRGLR